MKKVVDSNICTPPRNVMISVKEGPWRLDCDMLDDAVLNPYILPNSSDIGVVSSSGNEKNNIDQNRTMGISKVQKQMSPSQFPSAEQENEDKNGIVGDEPKIKRERLDDDEAKMKNETQNEFFIKTEIDEELEFKIEIENCPLQIKKEYDREDETPTNLVNEIAFDKRPEIDHFCMKLVVPLICNLCEVYIKGNIEEHIRNHHINGMFFSCPYCLGPGKFSKKKIAWEIRKHQEHFCIICSFCGEKFSNWLNAKQHLDQKHQDKVSRQCEICSFEASSYQLLINHILYCHDGETLKHNCQHCDYATLNISLLHLHMEAKHSIIHSPTIPDKAEEKLGSLKRTRKDTITSVCNYEVKRRQHFLTHIKQEHPDI